ncbi:MAG: hypothetical protein HY332_11185 [Chloroflexi bacterium]|nr:hypothetical protein [Chloroflexota bacterium]
MTQQHPTHGGHRTHKFDPACQVTASEARVFCTRPLHRLKGATLNHAEQAGR